MRKTKPLCQKKSWQVGVGVTVGTLSECPTTVRRLGGYHLGQLGPEMNRVWPILAHQSRISFSANRAVWLFITRLLCRNASIDCLWIFPSTAHTDEDKFSGWSLKIVSSFLKRCNTHMQGCDYFKWRNSEWAWNSSEVSVVPAVRAIYEMG